MMSSTQISVELINQLLGIMADEAADFELLQEKMRVHLARCAETIQNGDRVAQTSASVEASRYGGVAVAAAMANGSTVAIKAAAAILPAILKGAQRASRVRISSNIGRADPKTLEEFLEEIERFADSERITRKKWLERAVTAALVGIAKQWLTYEEAFGKWDLFRNAFLDSYASFRKEIYKRELESRTHDPSEPLVTFIHGIVGYYDEIGGNKTEVKKVKRVNNQIKTDYRRLLRGRQITPLKELSKVVPWMQMIILRDRLYRPSPQAEWSIDRSLA